MSGGDCDGAGRGGRSGGEVAAAALVGRSSAVPAAPGDLLGLSGAGRGRNTAEQSVRSVWRRVVDIAACFG